MELTPEVLLNPKKAKLVFNSLIQILETQKSQLETLTDERKRQEERIKDAYDNWLSGIRMLKATIDQLKMQAKLSEMGRMVEAAKTNLVFGLKMKEELVYKLKLENAEDELADFIEWFDILSHKCADGKDVSPEMLLAVTDGTGGENGSSKSASSKKVGRRALEKEVERLKCEYEKLSMKKSSEVSALSLEKEFAWNQYKEMENKYTTQLKEKNDGVSKLLETVEQLQSTSTEKDAEIAELKAKLGKMVVEVSKKDVEASRMLEELNSLKKCNGELKTPVLRGCSSKAVSSEGGRRKKSPPPRSRFSTAEPKAKAKALTSDDEHGSKRTTRSAKRKEYSSQDNKRVNLDEELPKLFSSDFKIPKLKISSLR